MRLPLLLSIAAISASSFAHAQTNSTGTIDWPANPPVGIGTQLSTPSGPVDALQIHHDPNVGVTMNAILRLSEGTGTNTSAFGILGLMPGGLTSYSSLSKGFDLILHEHHAGDLILSNWEKNASTGGAIRMATTGDTTQRPLGFPLTTHDLERMTILPNGNVGINLPPDSATGLGLPLDQIQIGGGVIAAPGNTAVIPGLTVYGGNRFEGMPKPAPDTGTYPVDWRGIAFNHYENHSTGYQSRFVALPWSGIGFGWQSGGLISLSCFPWHTGDSLTDTRSATTLEITGQNGLELWCDLGDSDRYHHLIDIWRPGFGGVRNVDGLCYHHTPVYIGGASDPDFTNLANVHPILGDGKTWMLAVNGAALAKEFFVSLDWPDYIFDPDYHLMPLKDVEEYIAQHHHLPGVPSADSLATTGVPLGQTEAQMMQKIEEQQLYIIELSKRLDALRIEIDELNKGAKQ